MAVIDKTYMTKEQFDRFSKWLFNYHSMDGETATFYFSTEIDKWLKENCDLDFIQQQLDEQYDGEIK